ncbi:MAG TPA: thioredoxin domain-containing protein, partial [Patescibacteria group bacterium]
TAGLVGTQPTAALPTDQGPTGPTADQLAAMPEVGDADHIRGNANAKVVLVEYSDYECPFCGRFHPTMQQLMTDFGDEIAWVYRHYPLPFHPNAQKSAEGGECVAELGGEEAFWNYTDALFEVNIRDGQLSPEAITTAATGAGVNEAAFTECLDSGRMAQVVQDQMSAGSSAGVSGTPGTFIVVDGEAKELIPGAVPVEQAKTMVEQYL